MTKPQNKKTIPVIPEKEKNTVRSITMPTEVFNQINELSEIEGRSFNAQAVWSFRKISELFQIAKEQDRSINGLFDEILKTFKEKITGKNL